jgi:glycosyltransferase involved in cell wall biosynthesis
MRYIWELERDYFGGLPWPASWYVRRVCAGLRLWDQRTAGRPTAVLANSAHVAERIRRHWGREATVVHPPVELDRFPTAVGERQGYLLAGAFAPYKRGDLALRACARLDRRLVVAGSGQQADALRRLGGSQVEFRGWISREQLPALYAGAKALIFPGEEDFGIVPVEALSSGTPVIAYGKGGVLETVGRGASPEALARVRDGGVARVPGGVLFGTQSVEALCAAIELFESERFDPETLHELAAPFSVDAFDHGFERAFEEAHVAWRSGRAGVAAD